MSEKFEWNEWAAPDKSAVPTATGSVYSGVKYRYHGTLHRTDGPAIVDNGVEEWWLNGVRLVTKEAFDLAIEEKMAPGTANKVVAQNPAFRSILMHNWHSTECTSQMLDRMI